MTSCEALTYLTQVCGAHYDDCHSNEEKREILRMWIKQFVQGTHKFYWESAFSDNNLKIVNGDCHHILNKFFSKEEMVEITDLVNTEPNLFFDCSNEWGKKGRCHKHQKGWSYFLHLCFLLLSRKKYKKDIKTKTSWG